MYNINEKVETIIESVFMLSINGIKPTTLLNESATSYGKYDVLIENAIEIATLLETSDSEPDASGAKKTLWNKFTNVNWKEKMDKIKETIKKIWKWISTPGRVLKDLITGKSTLKSILTGIKKKRQEAKDAKNKDVDQDLGKAEKEVESMMDKTDEQIKKKGGETSAQKTMDKIFDNAKNGKYADSPTNRKIQSLMDKVDDVISGKYFTDEKEKEKMAKDLDKYGMPEYKQYL